MQADQHIIGPLITFSAILIDDFRIAFLVNLAAEIFQVIMVVPFVAKITVKLVVVM